MKIVDAMNEYLVSSFDKVETNKKRKYYMSDMGKCERMRFLKRKGITGKFEPHVYWILQLGNILHDYGYKALESKGLLLESEERIETPHFSGRYDGIVPAGKKKAPFDFKSTGVWKMKKAMSGEDDEQAIKQVLSYTMHLQESGRDDIGNTAFIVYINKEPGNKMPYAFFQREYHLTSWRKKQLKEEQTKMVDYWEKDKLPRCTCPSWMKPYNSFKPLCDMPDIKVKKILKGVEKGKKYMTSNSVLSIIKDGKEKEVLTT